MMEGGTPLNPPDVCVHAIGPGYTRSVVELDAPPVE
jgi:hypothetical protein